MYVWVHLSMCMLFKDIVMAGTSMWCNLSSRSSMSDIYAYAITEILLAPVSYII